MIDAVGDGRRRRRGSASACGSTSPPGSASGGRRRSTRVVPSEQAVPLPASASFELGASLGDPRADGATTACSPTVRSRAARCSWPAARARSATRRSSWRTWAGARVIATVSSDGEGASWRERRARDVVVNYREDGRRRADRAAAPDGSTGSSSSRSAPNLELDLAVGRAARGDRHLRRRRRRRARGARPAADDAEPRAALRAASTRSRAPRCGAAVDGVSAGGGGGRADHAAAAPLPARARPPRRTTRSRAARSARSLIDLP